MEKNEQPLKLGYLLRMIPVAVLFGTIFYNVGVWNTTNNNTMENQEFIRKHIDDEDDGLRKDVERNDDWIIKYTDLKSENTLLKAKLENCN